MIVTYHNEPGLGSVALPAFDPISAAVSAITLGITAFFGRKKPGQKIATTNIVNEAEPYLIQNLQAFEASPKTKANKDQALANFDSVWNAVVQQCGDPALGDPGRWCVDDRKPGGKHDWFALYRDPIANTAIEASPGSLSFEGFDFGLNWQLLAAGALVVIAFSSFGD